MDADRRYDAPPLDAELAKVLAAENAGPFRLTPGMIAEVRATAPPSAPVDLERGGRFTVEEHTRAGVPLLIARPVTKARGCIYYIHGGGMMFGDNRRGVGRLLDWAEAFGLVAVSVDYRLAPEHPHPAPVEDCYLGLQWTAEHAGELGFNPAALVVAGISAGGGLAAAVALLARDRNGPALAGQLLLCPMLDDRNDSPSAMQMADVDMWDRVSNQTGWGALLGDADVSPYAAPARATDLSGLPPAFVDVGSAETLRDEGVAYASRIWQAGGAAELHVWPGGVHAFDSMAPDIALSRDARQARLQWLARILPSDE
ncbi:alpha/beta hydrolase [Winogradskya humida]|uniref:Esterase n=1 Tax=Winogradskya humida TaxID=113566 RepID=A0ABQ4A1F7_9ACTN|nr:alpha/beta hydrolase [Actinoplanes humidus]GIE24663.1 esterase [Actinoplanes humidus]